jgi:hypothetical protein
MIPFVPLAQKMFSLIIPPLSFMGLNLIHNALQKEYGWDEGEEGS